MIPPITTSPTASRCVAEPATTKSPQSNHPLRARISPAGALLRPLALVLCGAMLLTTAADAALRGPAGAHAFSHCSSAPELSAVFINAGPLTVCAPWDVDGRPGFDPVTIEVRDRNTDGAVDGFTTSFTTPEGKPVTLVEEANPRDHRWGSGSQFRVEGGPGGPQEYVVSNELRVQPQGNATPVESLRTYYEPGHLGPLFESIQLQGPAVQQPDGGLRVLLEPGTTVTVIGQHDLPSSPTAGRPGPWEYRVDEQGMLQPLDDAPTLTPAQTGALRATVAPDQQPAMAGFYNALRVGPTRIDFPRTTIGPSNALEPLWQIGSAIQVIDPYAPGQAAIYLGADDISLYGMVRGAAVRSEVVIKD
jgi:hypothetical protein